VVTPEIVQNKSKRSNVSSLVFEMLLCNECAMSGTAFEPTCSIGPVCFLKGLSHEIDFKNFDQNLQNLGLLRDAAGF
jgi:hypothetical protein